MWFIDKQRQQKPIKIEAKKQKKKKQEKDFLACY